MTTSREIRLKTRPVGLPTAANFDLVSVDLSAQLYNSVNDVSITRIMLSYVAR